MERKLKFFIIYASLSEFFSVDHFSGSFQGALPDEKRTQLNLFAIHPLDLGNLQDFAAFVPQPAQMYKKVKTGGNLSADHGDRKLYSHEDHGFQSADHILTGIGMDRGQTPVVPYIDSLEELGSFSGADFSYDICGVKTTL